MSMTEQAGVLVHAPELDAAGDWLGIPRAIARWLWCSGGEFNACVGVGSVHACMHAVVAVRG
jgi:hypothetical protein